MVSGVFMAFLFLFIYEEGHKQKRTGVRTGVFIYEAIERAKGLDRKDSF